ncbi:TonB-dependent receptor plug domain-containing protein [Methylomagnum sp.]
MRIKKIIGPLWLALGVLDPHAPVFADEKKGDGDDLEEELRFLRAESVVVTASKTVEQVDKSVATVTVIPERMIRQMGARNLLDVLRVVPGLGIGQSASGIRQLEVRGVMSTFSERVLIMLNGHSVDHNLFWGGSMWTYDDLPIDNVKRVEVVRGPGSALYGANAFLATINVITKDAGDIDGAAVAIGGGSHDTQQYNATLGKQVGEWHGMVNFNHSYTDGANSFVKRDALGFSGHTNLYERRNDVQWKVGYGKAAVFDGRYISKDTGSFVGPSAFLSSDTRFDHDDYFLRLTLEHQFTDRFTLTGRAYHSEFNMNQLLEFSKGRYNRFLSDSLKTGGELQANYRFNDSNTLIGGFAYESQQQVNVQHRAGLSPDTLGPVPPFAKNAERDLWGLYIQDLWDVTEGLRLMLGARYDQYSDFGGTFNPRMGFNWEFLPGYSARFAYGTAFRAPTFSELFTINNPTVAGNPNLKPENIDTYELGFNAKLTSRWSTELTLFRNDITDMIGRKLLTGTSFVYANLQGIQTNGLEFNTRYTLGEGSYLAANYTFQDSRFTNTGRKVPDTPEHRGTVQANFALFDHLHWYSEVLIKGPTSRAANDFRQDVPAYALVNTTWRALEILPGLELNFSVFNLLDKQAVYPFLPVVPGDFPQPDRTFFAKLRYEIK